MKILAVDEFNNDGHLIYAENFPGAYVRGRTREEALNKFPAEITQYCRWAALPCREPLDIQIVEKCLLLIKIRQ